MKKSIELSILVKLSVIVFVFLFGCKVSYLHSNKKFARHIAKNKLYEKDFTGVCIYDMDKKKYVIEHNHNRYFTPASTTKLFTFYTALKMLGTGLPVLQYTTRKDSLIFRGTGNPLLLHPDIRDSTAWLFLKNRTEKLYYSAGHFKDAPLGPGWAWDDYSEDYSAEKSPLPVYGNLVRFKVTAKNKVKTSPAYFGNAVVQDTAFRGGNNVIGRDFTSNIFRYLNLDKGTSPDDVPFLTSPTLTARLLADTLKKPVVLLSAPLPKDVTTLYGFPADSLYRKMLVPSDNFLAEQLLLMCGSQVMDSLNSELATAKVINYSLKHYLSDLSDQPRWVDGSGLSRMNLFTPRSMVELLLKIYGEVATSPQGEARLFNLLPTGGRTGTLTNVYKGYPPFIYAKTGTLSNNHSLCGYIVTKSGKRLCFSFMNNHYLEPTSAIRKEMERILTEYYLNY